MYTGCLFILYDCLSFSQLSLQWVGKKGKIETLSSVMYPRIIKRFGSLNTRRSPPVRPYWGWSDPSQCLVANWCKWGTFEFFQLLTPCAIFLKHHLSPLTNRRIAEEPRFFRWLPEQVPRDPIRLSWSFCPQTTTYGLNSKEQVRTPFGGCIWKCTMLLPQITPEQRTQYHSNIILIKTTVDCVLVKPISLGLKYPLSVC